MSDPRTELLQVIAELHMMSHVSAVNLEPGAKSSEESIGGRRPSGGIDRKDDREDEMRLKSADHFSTRARKCKSTRDYEAVLADARETLEAWRRTPVRDEPPLGDPMWRRFVVQSEKQDHELARFYGVDVRYIRRVRREAA